MKLSIVMMIKNESKHLEKCLRSIRPIQAQIKTEIIIVDTGSEDNSVEIAKKYTDKVYLHQWNNDFGAMRNISISYAEGEWIFVLDGDEVIESPEEFINFFKSKDSDKYNTGVIRIKSFSVENETKSTTALIPRLFRQDKDFKYLGAIHEQPNMKGPKYYFGTDILHYGYISTDPALMEKKYIRNTQILKSGLEKEPRNEYLWFQLSQSYSLYKNYEEALETALTAYEIAKDKGVLPKSIYIYNHLARMYFANKKYQETESICKEGIAFEDGYIDLYFFLAMAQKQLSNNAEAIKNYNKYLDMHRHYEDFAGSKDTSVPTCTMDVYEEAYTNLCILYYMEKQYGMALEYKDKISSSELLKVALPVIVASYIRLEKYSELKELYYTRILKEYKQITNDFTNVLEEEKAALGKQNKKRLIDCFSQGEDIYALLNIIRGEENSDEICTDATYIKRLGDVDFNKLPNYYGDIFYYLMKRNQLSIDMLKKLSDRTLESYFSYLILRYKKECADYVLSFIEEAAADDTMDNIRIRKVLRKQLLLSIFNDEEYEGIFKSYLKDGIAYINKLYNKDIILDERIYDVKNDEEAMFIYMIHAETIRNKDEIEYIRYLKKAINAYPQMAAGINIFIKELEDELNKHAENIKEQIKTMIDAGNFLRAHKLIYEYEKYKADDVQVLSMKAVIAIMENRLNDAEAVINEGLKVEDRNFDLLYNLKYVYESQGKWEAAEALQERIAYSMPTKRCIDPSFSTVDFFDRINEENIRYVVLECSDQLPNVRQGEHLAILVHDEDLVKISKYFIPYQAEAAVHCEVFSINAIQGSTDAALTRYPANIAEEIIKNRILHKGKIYVPCYDDFARYIAEK